MASKPGILTDWPWKPLGNFKVYMQSLFYLIPIVHVFNLLYIMTNNFVVIDDD